MYIYKKRRKNKVQFIFFSIVIIVYLFILAITTMEF